MAGVNLGFDLRSSPSGAPHADLTAAVLDMCEWADGLEGADVSVRLLEHHGSPDGYIPAPITLAAAIAGRTRRMRLSMVLLAPLYHPVRLAEELAILDLASRGRAAFILGAGYRKEEFDTFGVDLADRGRLMEETVEVLKKGWTGEPFEFRGTTVRVTPRPFSQPRPLIFMGGSSKAAARRAARIADGFFPTDPALMQTYRDELVALGKDPGPAPAVAPTGRVSTVVAVSEDPEATWREVGQHCLHEMNTYAAWLDGTSVKTFWHVADIAALRQAGRYLVLTPEQCVEHAKAQGGAITIHPLTGGIAPEVGWRSLKLIQSAVLPHLT